MKYDKHPTFLRALALANHYGSTATTVRGVLSYVRSLPPQRVSMWFRRELSWRSSDDWRAEVARRKSDPEPKRARKDRRFRKLYLARLRACEQRAQRCDGSTLDGVIQRIDSEDQRRAELREVARLRTIATGRKCEPLDPGAVPVCLIPIGEHMARKVGAPLIMRGKDATVSATYQRSCGDHQDAYTIWDKKGRPRGQRAVHDNYVRSFGFICPTDPRRLDCVFHETRVTVILPVGYVWDRDDHGLRAVDESSRRDDYHPGADALLRDDSSGYIAATINGNRNARARMAAQAAAEAADLVGVYVCLADSLRAGNCREGTLSFGRRHGLDPARHYGAQELLQMANGEAGRVRLAITAARLRHKREEAAGFCVLSDHR